MTQKEALARARLRGRNAWTRKHPEDQWFMLGWRDRPTGHIISVISYLSWEEAILLGDQVSKQKTG